jgi:hypothetical protein
LEGDKEGLAVVTTIISAVGARVGKGSVFVGDNVGIVDFEGSGEGFSVLTIIISLVGARV